MRNSQIKNKLSNHKKPFAIKQPLLFSPRAYRNFALGLFSFLCAYVVAGTFAPVQSSDASTVTITNNTTDYYITITSADNLPMSVEAKPTGQLAYASDSINITTNSDSGYKLYVSTSGNDNNIYQNGSSSTSSSGYFQPTTGTIANPVALAQNTWGFALNKSQSTSYSGAFANTTEYVNETLAPTVNSTWAGVPTFANSEQAKISELSIANAPGGTTFDIYYGVNASTTLPDGSYTTELTYTAISEGVNQFPTMQDFTAEQCYNMATNTTINLSDSRDDKYYRVTKMADGHCWMTDNLALDGTDAAGNVRVLTPSDSNVEQNRTLAANITDGTASDSSTIQILSSKANLTTDTCDTSNVPYCIVNASTKYGNMYNWKAATAGLGTPEDVNTTITESVCPKGWQLPDNDGVYSFQNLMLHYGLPITNATDGSTVQTIQQSPFFFTLSGYNSSYSGISSAFWSRTTREVASHAYDYAIDAKTGLFDVHNSNIKGAQITVRCVFSGQSTDPTMQDFTTTQCNNLATNASTVLVDRRNREFYRVVHAQDGNCWMADNLSIYGQDISATDSDFTSPATYTIPASITQTSEWASNIYDRPMVEVTHGLGASASQGPKYYGEVYYNWTSAVAQQDTSNTVADPNTSICPKNWQLPIASYPEAINKSWEKLLHNSYGFTNSAQLLENTSLGIRLYYGWWSFNSQSEMHQGYSGNIWTGTISNDPTSSDALVYIKDDYIGVDDVRNRGLGFSIRCVQR